MEQKEKYLDFCLLPPLPTLPPVFPCQHCTPLLSSLLAAFPAASPPRPEPVPAPRLPQWLLFEPLISWLQAVALTSFAPRVRRC